MQYHETEQGLTITADRDERRELGQMHKENPFDFFSDATMYDWFDSFIGNTEFEWIDACEIGALTSAPILGIVCRDDHGDLTGVQNVYGFMSYQVRSVLQDLQETGEAFFRRG